MEPTETGHSDGLASYFEGYRKSRAFSHGYSDFITAIAKADIYIQPSEKTSDQQNESITTQPDEQQ